MAKIHLTHKLKQEYTCAAGDSQRFDICMLKKLYHLDVLGGCGC